MDTIIYQKIDKLQEKLNIIYKSYCDAREVSKRKELWKEVNAIETEIDGLYDLMPNEVHLD